MPTLSIHLTPKLEETIDGFVERGYASNRVEVVQKAIEILAKEEAISAVLEAEREVTEGKILKGDLQKLMKQIK